MERRRGVRRRRSSTATDRWSSRRPRADQIGMAGLSHGDTNTDFADVDFGIELYPGPLLHRRGAASIRGVFGPYATDDRFAVDCGRGRRLVSAERREDLHERGGAGLSAAGRHGALHAGRRRSRTSCRAAAWRGRSRGRTWSAPTAAGGALTKTARPAGMRARRRRAALVSGDGAVEFAAAETNTTRMLGLSRDNSNTDYSDIDFALYLYSNATVYIVEGGVTRGTFGATRPTIGSRSRWRPDRSCPGATACCSTRARVAPVVSAARGHGALHAGRDAGGGHARRHLRDRRDVCRRGRGRRQRQHADEDRRAGLERRRGLDARAGEGRRLRRVHDQRGDDAEGGRVEPRQYQYGLRRRGFRRAADVERDGLRLRSRASRRACSALTWRATDSAWRWKAAS